MRRPMLLAVLTIVVLMLGVAAGPAAAAKRAGTTVVISLKVPAFHGTLGSTKACKSGRTVRLYKVKGGPDKLLKRGTSNKKGKWSTPIGKKVPPGSYYVKAVARGNCKAGKSKTLTIPG
jgi:hypothetical protein